jgi:hypothetical protein
MRSNSVMQRHTSPFPPDLLKTQTAWYTTYRALADTPPTGTGAAAHRRRLLVLSARITSHPFWDSPAGTPAARVALKEIARARAQR